MQDTGCRMQDVDVDVDVDVDFFPEACDDGKNIVRMSLSNPALEPGSLLIDDNS